MIVGAGSGAETVWGTLPALAPGTSVAVVEAHRVGGECPYVACMPSKALLHEVGLRRLRAPTAGGYAAAVARRDAVAAQRDDREAAAELTNSGAVLVRGRGTIEAAGVLAVHLEDGTTEQIGWRDLVIATGSVAVRPPVPGLSEVATWSSDEALSSAELPTRLVVLGGGPVGCELAQVYATFGSAVTVVESDLRLVPREDPEVGDFLAGVLSAAGVTVRTGVRVDAVEATGASGSGEARLSDGTSVPFDRLLLATGRRPAVDGIGLANLGFTGDVLTTDRQGRVTGLQRVWAAGDVTGAAPFTHTATYQGRAVGAGLAGKALPTELGAIPRAVYTVPPAAAVGLTVAGAEEAGLRVQREWMPLAKTARGLIDDAVDSSGGVYLLADTDAGVLVGACVTGPSADELIGELTLAVRARIPLEVLADVVHPFPTYGEALQPPLRRLADQPE